MAGVRGFRVRITLVVLNDWPPTRREGHTSAPCLVQALVSHRAPSFRDRVSRSSHGRKALATQPVPSGDEMVGAAEGLAVLALNDQLLPPNPDRAYAARCAITASERG